MFGTKLLRSCRLVTFCVRIVSALMALTASGTLCRSSA
jgi:hypothetical protein